MPQLFASSSSFFASVRSVSLGVGWWRTQHLFFFPSPSFFFLFFSSFFFFLFFFLFFSPASVRFPVKTITRSSAQKKKKKMHLLAD